MNGKTAVFYSLCLGTALGTAQAATRYVVPPNTAGVNPSSPYGTWGTAATNLHDVMAAMAADTVVLVTNGWYRLTNQVTVAAARARIVGFSGNPADVIVDGGYPNRTNRCFYVTGAGVRLASLTVTNGYAKNVAATGEGGGVWLNAGGALITNCVIAGNRAFSQGGGVQVYNHGRYSIVNSWILGNQVLTNSSAANGGGIYIRRGLCIVSNCVIRGNQAPNGGVNGASGGGFYVGVSGTCTVYRTHVVNNLAAGSGGGAVSGAGTFVDCTIASNTAAYYGGVVGVREVRNCTVAYNRATYRWGGGVTMSYRGYGLISNCLVYGNSAYISYGAGICIVNQRADILDCIVSNNLNDCSPGVTLGYGAGIAFNLATGAIRNCTIVDNRVTKGSGFQYGGGLAKIGPGDLSVDRCTFARNAGPMGGGAFVTNTAFRNCLFLSNTGATEGAAMYLRANSTLVNCTVARNVSVPSGAVAAYAVGSGIGMVNCIVQSNTNQTSGLTANHANSAALPFTNSCAMPLPAFGAANIPDTPRFVDLSAGNCRLQSLSPCRDRGLFQAWMNGAPDLDGKRRIMGSDVDMGCYEFFVPRGTAFEIH